MVPASLSHQPDGGALALLAAGHAQQQGVDRGPHSRRGFSAWRAHPRLLGLRQRARDGLSPAQARRDARAAAHRGALRHESGHGVQGWDIVRAVRLNATPRVFCGGWGCVRSQVRDASLSTISFCESFDCWRWRVLQNFGGMNIKMYDKTLFCFDFGPKGGVKLMNFNQ